MFNLFGSKARAYEEITPQEAEQRLKQERPLVVDVREPYEFARGHIAGSKSIPLGQLGTRLKEFGPQDRTVIVVCQSGNRSSFAANQLASNGYKKVINLRGGMSAWQRAGLPTQR